MLWQLVASSLLASILLLVRFVTVLLSIHDSQQRKRTATTLTDDVVLGIFLGSGGHTAEMFRLISTLDTARFPRRRYVISSGDTISPIKVRQYEQNVAPSVKPQVYDISLVPRARRVHQSFLTAPLSTYRCFQACVKLLWSTSPYDNSTRRPFADLMLMNGPGSCLPFCLVAFLAKALGRPSPRLIYIESFARISSRHRKAASYHASSPRQNTQDGCSDFAAPSPFCLPSGLSNCSSHSLHTQPVAGRAHCLCTVSGQPLHSGTAHVQPDADGMAHDIVRDQTIEVGSQEGR
ncbi:glycosyltransferase family 1 protein [Mixia osmundae IAM 14324]|uniref:UDP-N-acetylglucosamine transferase subunit ALG14 n=1 Tax=Mixia osmundae (strain CBS 9802 / IAM 14324 / JCM 22182 / KY 12970) TaxID=764103 RepID=G7E3P9_MIXOS|nr:glycosyltransferase family 1 protein [Mixia osmundae IAM 14324]KEI41881.1 glycosyltransferase family 1 protein [Mixia osmundae IAM 14324]GAA97459.1 hypothetical protein E5Q_04138 [Mixia osmundae IAM 14324]